MEKNRTPNRSNLFLTPFTAPVIAKIIVPKMSNRKITLILIDYPEKQSISYIMATQIHYKYILLGFVYFGKYIIMIKARH